MQTYFKMLLWPHLLYVLPSTDLNLEEYSEEIKGPIFYELKQDGYKKLNYYCSSKSYYPFIVKIFKHV